MNERESWHFIGIGGAGMSGLAHILLSLGERVSGCDAADGPALDRLRARGAAVSIGHDPDHLRDGMRVVVSSAIRPDEPELLAARARGLEVVHRGDLLADLFRTRRGVAVCGTHGKSTTTGLTAMVLRAAGLDPTIVAGADLPDVGGNAHLGRDPWIVAEADESDGSFTKIAPTVAVVTNIDDDHLDHYGTVESLIDAFRTFVRRVPPDGCAVVCGDDPHSRSLAPLAPSIVYGLREPAELTATDIDSDGWGSRFTVRRGGRALGRAEIRLPGLHNVSNALAALAAGLALGLPAEALIPGLATFHGARRRFQVLGRVDGVTVVDDYAHHPTEIATTLRAARAVAQGRVIVLFQPHRYTRTRILAAEFGPAFADADLLFLAPIYSAGEPPLPGVDSSLILDAVRRFGRPEVELFADREAMVRRAAAEARPGDLILSMGAGDIRRDGERLVALLSAGEERVPR
ncbi:MAG: UDP-N-acetylmuramate--L-alanine ligase [Firmicutes bacterium]|nr:UDP-N-acetylmuramate--L-alanine ligase [Bacillota bacterium]